MNGLIAPTDYDWYAFLHQHGGIEEINFWRPSAERRVRAEPFTPFLLVITFFFYTLSIFSSNATLRFPRYAENHWRIRSVPGGPYSGLIG
jgi:hypothetical protein